MRYILIWSCFGVQVLDSTDPIWYNWSNILSLEVIIEKKRTERMECGLILINVGEISENFLRGGLDAGFILVQIEVLF